MKLIMAVLCVALFSKGAQASCYAQLKQQLPQSGTIVFGEIHGSTDSTDAQPRRAGDADVVFSSEDPAYNGYFRVGSLSGSRPVIEK